MRINTAAGYLDAVVNHVNALHPVKPDDYTQDGLLYCGKCKTPRETKIKFPGIDEAKTVPIACECRMTERERERLEKDRQATEYIRKQALPYDKYREMTFANSDTPVPFAEKYVAQWDNMYRENIGLLLHGSVGTGKTYIAAAIANALVDRGEWVYMHNMAAMSSALRDNFKGGHADLMNRVQMSHLFVIDDFGAECMTDYALQNTYELIEARMESGKPMIVTTNLSPGSLAKTDDMRLQRLYSRLTSLHPVGITGEDRRKTETKRQYDDINAILGIGKTSC